MQLYPQLENMRTELPDDVRPNWQRDPELSECLFIEWSPETVELFGNNIIKSVSKNYFSISFFCGDQYTKSAP